MQPTGVYSLALVATAAALFSSAEAHGQMTVPEPRPVTEKFRADSGALNGAGDQELQYAPTELLSQRSQSDFPEAETFNILNGCRGFVYEEGNTVTTIAPGADFDVEWTIQAPHPGYMNLSVVKPSTDAVGKITYEIYKTLLTIEPFAETGGDGSTTATMASDIEGCGSAGDCALQFYWHSDTADQTYPTCADIIVSGSGAGTGASTSTTASSAAGSEETATSAGEETEAPSATTAPSTATTAPTTATTAPSTATSAPTATTVAPKATTASPAATKASATEAPSVYQQEVAGESDASVTTDKCNVRRRRD